MRLQEKTDSSGDRKRVAERVLLEQEAKGLELSIVTRSILLTALIVLSPLFAPDILSVAPLLTFCGLGIGLMLYCRSLVRAGDKVKTVGLIGAIFDMTLLALVALGQWADVNAAGAASLGRLRTEDTLCVLLAIVNSLALRPLYPALVAGWAVLIDSIIAAWILAQPEVVVSFERAARFAAAELYAPSLIARLVGLVVAGFFLAWLTRSARQTALRVAVLENAQAEARQRQAELIVNAKVSSLTSLVAGIAHEVHTPLGVLLSAVATSGSSVPKLREAIDRAESLEGLRANRRLGKILGILADTPKSANEAGRRIAGLVGSLKEFAHLDEADVQLVDLSKEVERSLAVVQPTLQSDVEIVRRYEEVSPYSCRPRELNQVLETILTNAFEAMDGRGTLTLEVRRKGENVLIVVTDTGKGLSPEQLDGLFEIDFDASSGRVKMHLGLPTGRLIVQRMGGDIEVESSAGRGASFSIRLPLQTGAG